MALDEQYSNTPKGQINHELIISLLRQLTERLDAINDRIEVLETLHNRIVGAFYVLGLLFISIAPILWWFISKALPVLEKGVK